MKMICAPSSARDRNHPCVILWSSGNEVPDQDKPDGPALAKENVAIIHSEDPTRPVTAAVSSYNAGFSGFQNSFEVFGWNYKPMNYGQFREKNPNIAMFGSETASCISSRGEYFFPVSTNKAEGQENFQMSSYDLYAPRWATTPDTEFAGQEKNPFVAGEFVWTGFDYLGEPTPYNGDMSNLLNFHNAADQARAQKELEALGKIQVPSRSSYFGIIESRRLQERPFLSVSGPTGGPICTWRTSFRTGTGRSAPARSRRCMCIPRATPPNYF